MTKILFLVFVFLTSNFSTAQPQIENKFSTADKAEIKSVWNISTGFPARSKQHRVFSKNKKRALQKSRNTITVNLFDRTIQRSEADSSAAIDIVAQLKSGNLNAALITAIEAEQLFNQNLYYNQPFLFCDRAEVAAIRQDADKLIIESLPSNDYTPLAIVKLDMLNLMSDSPIYSVEDLSDKTLALPKKFSRLSQYFKNISPKLNQVEQSDNNSIKLHMPLELVMNKRISRPNYVMQRPASMVYFFLVVNTTDWLALPDSDQQLLTKYLIDSAAAVDKINTAASSKAMRLVLRKKQLVTTNETPTFKLLADTNNEARNPMSLAVNSAITAMLRSYRQLPESSCNSGKNLILTKV